MKGQISVREVMSTDVISVSPAMSLAEAARVITAHDLSGVPVVDERETLVGIVSQTDILHAAFPHHAGAVVGTSGAAPAWSFLGGPKGLEGLIASDAGDVLRHTRVQDVMADEVASVSPDTSVATAAGLMRAKKIHRLAVVEAEKLIGMVSALDILQVVEK